MSQEAEDGKDKKPEEGDVQEKPKDTQPDPEPKPKEESKSEIMSVKEIDELYEDIKRAAESKTEDPDREKELVRKAIEAERKRQAQLQDKQKEQEEKERMRKKMEELEKQLSDLREAPTGRKSQVPQGNPFEKTEDNKLKVPKKEFDQAVKDWVRKGGK